MASNARNTTMNQVMEQLGNRAHEISNMLPQDLPIDRFQANVLNALRNTPSILDCTAASIIKSCMKAAYDGLRLDGREAALVVHENTYGKGSEARKVKEAQYFPMAFGLNQQILRGGEVTSIYADVIYENDEYMVQRGTNAGIHHIPNLTMARGKPLAAYSVAKLKSGDITFELLTRQDIADIRGSAKTKNVWERWEGEMWKKSATRRHRKTLPLGERDIIIRDAEQDDMFDLGDQNRLPAPDQRQQERPTRAAIADQQGTESGAAMDLGHDEDGVIIEQGEQQAKGGQATQRAEPDQQTQNATAEQEGAGETVDCPGTDEEWSLWSQDIEADLLKAETADIVNEIAKREEKRLAAATKGRADYIRGLITDKLADILTGGSDDQ